MGCILLAGINSNTLCMSYILDRHTGHPYGWDKYANLYVSIWQTCEYALCIGYMYVYPFGWDKYMCIQQSLHVADMYALAIPLGGISAAILIYDRHVCFGYPFLAGISVGFLFLYVYMWQTCITV